MPPRSRPNHRPAPAGLYTTEEAAQLTRVTDRRIQLRIEAGLIQPTRNGGHAYFYTLEDLVVLVVSEWLELIGLLELAYQKMALRQIRQWQTELLLAEVHRDSHRTVRKIQLHWLTEPAEAIAIGVKSAGAVHLIDLSEIRASIQQYGQQVKGAGA